MQLARTRCYTGVSSRPSTGWSSTCNASARGCRTRSWSKPKDWNVCSSLATIRTSKAMSLLVCDLACRHFDSPIASLDRPARLGDDRQSSERPLNAIPGFEPLLTEKQAAELLNVPASTLKYWRDCGDGP